MKTVNLREILENMGYIDKEACPDYLDIIFKALPEEKVEFI
ncbi:MAG: hypothetical protein CHKLHMKO_00225 [Candidatus Argoarchaeum ethanivorans]|uniref:Uncharacterized protein n=1 Tax=Candidatus Argoarchaeum ethanivorans TaxID=2608793 RepID=A0A811T8X4_9EURY|nr:MAG: hypothetical protein CHKLHMKO_00225 [Candidatus Argoarchaeum ethanivorans]